MKKWVTTGGCEIIQVLSGRSNVFLLSKGEKTILVDTSVSRSWNLLQKRLASLGVNSVDYLILTHSHFDHAANANRVKARYNALVVIHGEEAGYLSRGESILPKGTIMFTRLLVNLLGKRFNSFLSYEPCHADQLAQSKHKLPGFGDHVYLMPTPGHTPGSMCLVADDEIAIVGDAMFGVFKNAVFPPFAVDLEMMVNSWGKLLETNCLVFFAFAWKGKKQGNIAKRVSKKNK